MFGWDPLPRTLEAALRDARDPKQWVRLSAVRDLARYTESPGKEQAVETLRRALEEDASAEVRGAAAVALADVGAEGSTGVLVGATLDRADHVRQMALLALGEIGVGTEGGALAAIHRALGDGSPAIRFQGLIALVRLASGAAEPSLITATRDDDAEVRHIALRLLEERATDETGGIHASAEALDAAEAALSDADLRVRTAAAILLARSGRSTGHAALVAACESSGRRLDSEDEQAVIDLVGELGIEAARPALERRAWGAFGLRRTRTSHAARVALARFGDERAIDSIERSLRAWNRDERTLAVVSAGQARLVRLEAELRALRDKPERVPPEAVEDALSLLSGTERT